MTPTTATPEEELDDFDGGSTGSDVGSLFRADSDGELHLNFDSSSSEDNDGRAHDHDRHDHHHQAHHRRQKYESALGSRVFHLKTNGEGGEITILQGGAELGTVVWRGAVLLCERLRKNPELVARQRVLEVGAGCGVCSFLVGFRQRISSSRHPMAALVDYSIVVFLFFFVGLEKYLSTSLYCTVHTCFAFLVTFLFSVFSSLVPHAFSSHTCFASERESSALRRRHTLWEPRR